MAESKVMRFHLLFNILLSGVPQSQGTPMILVSEVQNLSVRAGSTKESIRSIKESENYNRLQPTLQVSKTVMFEENLGDDCNAKFHFGM